MNYIMHYNKLIERAKNRILTGYVENHHIIPRCMGGTDDYDNIVPLTAEEHYVAHQLLVKIYPDNKSLIYAATMMTVSSSVCNRAANKRYKWLREKYASICKERIGSNNPSFGSYWINKIGTTENMKIADGQSIPEGYVKGRVITGSNMFSIKTCMYCSCVFVSKKNVKICSEECRKKYVTSSSFKSKMKETATVSMSKFKGVKHDTTECPHCGKIGGIRAMKRHHFDNCKGLRL